MKKYLIILFSVIFSGLLIAQNHRWEIHIETPYDNVTVDVIETYDNGYCMAGLARDNGYFVKLDVNGGIRYEKTIGHTELHGGSLLFAVVQDGGGNTYIGGCGARIGTFFPFVTKLDPCGNPLWCKFFPNPKSYTGTVSDILINDNGELVILMAYSGGDLWDQVYLVNMSTEGTVLFNQAYARLQDYPLITLPSGLNIIQHKSDYYISGYCYYPYPDDPDHVFLRPMFIRVSSTFKEIWMKPFHVLDSVWGDAYTIIPINDSLLMGVGMKRQFEEDEVNSLLMFFRPDGEELGYKQIHNRQIGPDIQSNFIHDIARINDSLFMTASPYGTSVGVNPIGDIVIDTSGSIYRIKSHPQTVQWPALSKTFDGNYVVSTGKIINYKYDVFAYKIDENTIPAPYDTTQRVYDSLCPHQIESGIIDLTECLVVTDIEELPGPEEYYESIRHIPIKVHPNPVKDGRLTLEFENTTHHQNMQLRCYDSFGRQLHSQKIYKGQQETKLDVSGWSAGIYVTVMYSNGGACGKVKFVVE
ncbi:MAG: T9SS type A sorting domain-containing protein [Bacteroidales bacterium]|nr:T9SS type A sorting domain-containing protein [Bacteroidales bacterium]